MDFSLNDEQAMLKESVVQYIEKSYSFDQRMDVIGSDQPFSKKQWQEFAELGWLSLPFSLDDDGFGGGPVELMLIMQELGKGMVIEPYLACVVMAGGCVSNGANASLRQSLLPLLMSGELQLALAYAEKHSRFDVNKVRCTAVLENDGYRINGEKIVVLNGATADKLIVSVRTQGDDDDVDGITLFCVDATAQGVVRQGYRTVDGMHGAHIQFDNVLVSAADMISELHQGHALLSQTIQTATLAVCAEAVGIMDAMTQKTIEYTKSRQQFGVPLSSFQALQHRMVDMFIQLEQSRSLLLRAVIKSDEHNKESANAIAALKFYVGTAGRKLAEEAVQLHGGMGVTEEMDIAHLFMRLTIIDTLFGNSDWQLSNYSLS